MAEGITAESVFEETKHKFTEALGRKPTFDIVTNQLLGGHLLKKKDYDYTKSRSLSSYEKGTEVAGYLLEKIKSDDDPVGCLLKICEIFQSKDVDDDILKKYGKEMKNKFQGKEKKHCTNGGASRQGNHEEIDGQQAQSSRQRSQENGGKSKEEPQKKASKQDNNNEQKNDDEEESSDEEEPMTKDSKDPIGQQDGAIQPPKQDSDKKKSDKPKGPPDWEYDDVIVNYFPKKVEFTEDLVKGIEILLLPATDTEEKEVMYYLKQSAEKPVKTKIDRVKIHVGYYGKSKAIVIKTAPATNMQGSVYAAIITTKILERVKSIKYVVAVGVCFGKGSPEKQELGDVVISTMICDCLSIRQSADKESRRGGDYSVKQDILSEFECPHNFEMPLNIKVLKVPIVTTPNLINNSKIKDELFKKSPIAKAGEMEGAGIMAAIEYAPERAEVIVIKGIGDWGDETKEDTKEWKPFAARAAAHYVHAILSLDK